MIVDLVRNDLGRVCEYGSVTVPALWSVEEHPGLCHLVSTVEGTLRAGIAWGDVIGATFPPGSVTGAPKLAALDVLRRLEPGRGWADLLAAAAPAGSVSGAPKSSALRIIGELEPAPRGVYCGAFGWVDADTKSAELAVAIRTFEWRDGRLHLGTGAGITWGSDPVREWDETELKVSRLLEVAG